MPTSVKIAEKDKEKLEKLQAMVTLKAGCKVTQQELLSTLISEALERGEEFIDKVYKTNIPMPDQEYEKILSLVEDWGVETGWEEMDRMLYGAHMKSRSRDAR
ncbi:MAG: hypothetical protein ACP5K1_03615 [Candidatus Bathyarchaeia archaeon]